jgi:hypothetical protein
MIFGMDSSCNKYLILTFFLYRSHENLKRGMINVGTLVKSALGIQTTNGVLNQAEVEVKPLGPKPRGATIDKFGVLSSLRIGIQQARPGESIIVRLILCAKNPNQFCRPVTLHS